VERLLGITGSSSEIDLGCGRLSARLLSDQVGRRRTNVSSRRSLDARATDSTGHRSVRTGAYGPDLDDPFHDHAHIVTRCGRICIGRRKINLSTVFAGQKVGVKEVSDRIWLVSFMHYDLGYFDHESCRLESAENPFGAKVLPMSSE